MARAARAPALALGLGLLLGVLALAAPGSVQGRELLDSPQCSVAEYAPLQAVRARAPRERAMRPPPS
jgi:hypothetical protein